MLEDAKHSIILTTKLILLIILVDILTAWEGSISRDSWSMPSNMVSYSPP